MRSDALQPHGQRPNGPTLCQPRPTAWETESPQKQSPNGAALRAAKDVIGPPLWGSRIDNAQPGALPWADIGLARWAGILHKNSEDAAYPVRLINLNKP